MFLRVFIRIPWLSRKQSFVGRLVSQKKILEVEVKRGREISEVEIETLSYLLFRWWKREFEQRRVEVIERGNQKE